MKTRHYLHEDLTQIRYYFPNTHAVRIKIPFDLTIKASYLYPDVFHEKDTQPVMGRKVRFNG